uniref:Uncharacterized protein n=1 Tax=Kalanchoe fedtschenkoi TaxID=63787 RepID=A0A7N0VMT2_KALFE
MYNIDIQEPQGKVFHQHVEYELYPPHSEDCQTFIYEKRKCLEKLMREDSEEGTKKQCVPKLQPTSTNPAPTINTNVLVMKVTGFMDGFGQRKSLKLNQYQ